MKGRNRQYGHFRIELFEALSHSTRIKILQILSKFAIGYSDLKREAWLKSSGILSFHLGKLARLVKIENGNYTLTNEGREALRILSANNMKMITSQPKK